MATKLNPGEHDCYAAALPDEPLFVLLARDPDAPTVVRIWAKYRAYQIARGSKPAEDKSMVAEALACARSMEAWREANDGRWRGAPVTPVYSTTAEIRSNLRRLVESNPNDGMLRLVGLLLSDFERSIR